MSSKRVRIISLTGIILIALIIGVSLLVNLLFKDTRELPLPDPGASAGPTDTAGVTENNGLEHVIITTDNVQDVIATLQRPPFYQSAVQIEMHYEGGKTTFSISTSFSDGATALRKIGGGTNENIVIAEGVLYIWYDGDKTPYKRRLDSAEDEKKSSDAYQMIMTYEDILALEKSSIMDAGYVEYGDNGEYCIYVQYVTERLHYTAKCYISVESGLLIHAEKYDGDTLIYKMTTADFSPTQPDPSAFQLPDGSNPVSDP